ncbi:Nitric oxide reductase transcription regulator NorR2 [bacterium HR30]|nr:Nitric oxide reductase transcription regulator NorR2 [bacterium HR30]
MFRSSAPYEIESREERGESGHERWVSTWAEFVGQSLRPPRAPLDGLASLMELITVRGTQVGDGLDVSHIVGKVAAVCCQPPLGFSWVAFYLREGQAFRYVEANGYCGGRQPTTLTLSNAPCVLATSHIAEACAEYLPWLPLRMLVERDGDGTFSDSVLVLPLIAFGELTGLLCAPREDVQRCFNENTACQVVAVSASLAIALFVYRRMHSIPPSFGPKPGRGRNVPEAAGKIVLGRSPTEAGLFPELVGQSAPFLHALALAQRWAAGRAPVLITGETGTGKELLARAIHALSERRGGPWVAVNCPAIPRELAESELFGHEKGAFTGATEARVGRFERADGGVLFLDEVGDLPHTIQAKLLRVLQEGEIERVGSVRTKKVDVRVIAATNRDLQEAVRLGDFRKDLYHRLSALPIHLPPLRERAGDVELLAWHFLRKSRDRYGKRIEGMAPGVIEKLEAYDWPGNVRELEYVIERAVLLAVEPVLRVEDLADLDAGQSLSGLSLHARLRMEKLRRVEATLRQTQGNCAEAARLLGMSRGNFTRLLRTLRVDPRRFRLD